jgi:hypothetical protein
MALNCESNFFAGTGDHTETIRRGLVGVAISIAFAIAFARAWANILGDYREEKCPDKCKKKTGLFGVKPSYRVVGNRVTATVRYILLVRCSPEGRDEDEPRLAPYEDLERVAPPPASGRRGRKTPQRGARKRKAA